MRDMSRLLLGACAGLALSMPAALAEIASGEGRAPIGKDIESVRTIAESEARRAIVTQMLLRTIGQQRMGEVGQQQIDSIAGQIGAEHVQAIADVVETHRRRELLELIDSDGANFHWLLVCNFMCSTYSR